MVTYRQAGVDIDAGNELVRRIKKVAPEIGFFSGLFNLDLKGYKKPVLVSSTDGVGTKLKLAFMLDKHDTVGIDLVAMNANDLVVAGAKQLFFLDYYACGKLDVDTAEKVVKGIVNGCRQAGCALLGGETAEMPGFYPVGEYDIAGFVVGIVDREKVIDGSTIKPGDTVLGLPSSGPHSNGYSLIRRVFNKRGELKKYAKELFAPTKIYVKDILSLLAKGVKIKGMAHITGGGFYDNIPRVLPKNCGIVIHKKSWEIPRIFEVIQKRGNVPEHEMYRTLNMGIGLVIVADVKNAARIKKLMPAARYIGEVVKGKSEVVVK